MVWYLKEVYLLYDGVSVDSDTCSGVSLVISIRISITSTIHFHTLTKSASGHDAVVAVPDRAWDTNHHHKPTIAISNSTGTTDSSGINTRTILTKATRMKKIRHPSA